jgi:hypothetical protein
MAGLLFPMHESKSRITNGRRAADGIVDIARTDGRDKPPRLRSRTFRVLRGERRVVRLRLQEHLPHRFHVLLLQLSIPVRGMAALERIVGDSLLVGIQGVCHV